MLGTPLVGATTATVAEGVATLADVALVGAATTATWSVAAGATRVPVSTPLVLTATAPIAAVDVSATTVRVQTGGVDVDVRRTLSSTGRTLTLVPVAALRAGTTYTLTVAGLRDTYGQLVVVAPVPFTTAADTPLVLDPQGLVLGMPDAQGRVLVTAAAGALSAAATVLVVNTGNGQVSSFTVGNDGSLSGEIVASIQDRLLVTVADPTGRHVTIERSQYVAADGTTAVGVAGGTVVGTGGTAIRIPAAALAQAAVWKVTGLASEEVPAGPVPDLPGLTLAGGMRIETTGVTRLATEAKLVFPKPAAAPEGATYVVVRRLQGPEGRVAYETLDYASVEGTGADAKVVTASAPFAGYISSINGYAAMGLDVGGGASGQLTNYALLLWAFDQAMPGRPMGGTITGKVVRTVWAAGAAEPTYEPVVGALVSGVDVQGQPLWALAPGPAGANVAVTQADGIHTARMDSQGHVQ